MASFQTALPKSYDPHWTEIAFITGRGRDAPGIETHGELILTPGPSTSGTR